MPIYEFLCESCGYQEDLMRKISEPAKTECPKCGSQNFIKQVSAANFKLKGSGWYETDFKGTKKPAKSDEKEKTDASPKKEKANTSPAPTAGKDASSTSDK